MLLEHQQSICAKQAEARVISRSAVAALLDEATPLHAAALRGNPAQIDHLLFCKANPMAYTAAGDLPFELVPQCSHKSWGEMLQHHPCCSYYLHKDAVDCQECGSNKIACCMMSAVCTSAASPAHSSVHIWPECGQRQHAQTMQCISVLSQASCLLPEHLVHRNQTRVVPATCHN